MDDDIARLYDQDPPIPGDDAPLPPPTVVTPPAPSNGDEDESDKEIRVSNRYTFRKNPKRKVWIPDASAFFQAW